MEDLVENLIKVVMIVRRIRMRLEVVVRTRRETIQIVFDKEGKELEEDALAENISTAMKKGIDYLNVLSAKEGMTEEMIGRLGLLLLMKMQGHHILKMLKEEKS